MEERFRNRNQTQSGKKDVSGQNTKILPLIKDKKKGFHVQIGHFLPKHLRETRKIGIRIRISQGTFFLLGDSEFW